MRFVDEFRDAAVIAKAVEEIRRLADSDRHYRFMEVCGGHTHAIYRFGLKDLLPPNIELVHGPGWPVCVLPMGRIDDSRGYSRSEVLRWTIWGRTSAIGCAGANRNHSPRLRRQPINPLARRDWLPGIRVCSPSSPVAFLLDPFVRNRALHDQHKRIEFTPFSPVEVLHELIANLGGKHRVMQVNLRKSRNGPEQDLLDTGLLGSSNRNRVTVAAQACGDPEYMQFFDIRGPIGPAGYGRRHAKNPSSVAWSCWSVVGRRN